ncbi:MAG: hypothetical protein FJ403_07850 [Verrucomicrobia bacterium]|nr:hypothetical protein [Verrucomicrobiota bacterium]
MLLRLSLVVAILAGLAAIYFSHFKVSERITNLTSERDTALGAQRTAEDAQRKAQADAKKAKEDATKVTTQLNDTMAAFQETKIQLTEQQKTTTRLDEELNRERGILRDVQQELAGFKLLGIKPEELKKLQSELTNTRKERDAFVAENKILLQSNNQLRADLSRYTGDKEVDIPLPAGLKGKVLAVDPKYDFVVLDIGSTQQVVERAKMLVNRDGKFVGKVQITKVEPNRSIANILPDWKQEEVLEGDMVITQ